MNTKRQKARLALLGVAIHDHSKHDRRATGFHWGHEVNKSMTRTGIPFITEKDCIRDAWAMLTKKSATGDLSGSESLLALRQVCQIDRLNLMGVTVTQADTGSDDKPWAAMRPSGEGTQVIAQYEKFGSLIKHTWQYLIAEAKE